MPVFLNAKCNNLLLHSVGIAITYFSTRTACRVYRSMGTNILLLISIVNLLLLISIVNLLLLISIVNLIVARGAIEYLNHF